MKIPRNFGEGLVGPGVSAKESVGSNTGKKRPRELERPNPNSTVRISRPRLHGGSGDKLRGSKRFLYAESQSPAVMGSTTNLQR
jgi:hypothetical protein